MDLLLCAGCGRADQVLVIVANPIRRVFRVQRQFLQLNFLKAHCHCLGFLSGVYLWKTISVHHVLFGFILIVVSSNAVHGLLLSGGPHGLHMFVLLLSVLKHILFGSAYLLVLENLFGRFACQLKTGFWR